MPVLAFTLFNQWSNRPGASRRMVLGGALFTAIVLACLFAAYLAS